ncbi:MAG: hypothetical protein A3K59_07360 [Euryarchaeota archaeon RBG_19FT_COMBO_69_17]|nr:MAG: hypothetical protein A3K59_07360 [Euryarchaeota archaeon RBG_19FT_COMBO_69_17]
MSPPKKVVRWLLEEDQPAVRYLTLTRLLGRPEDDGEVAAAREQIPVRGWAAEILAGQNPTGVWVSGDSLYQPKYLSTNWMLLILADLGLTEEDSRIRAACKAWIDRFARPDGGFGPEGSKTSHLCIAGNTARALVAFGYADDPRVRSAFEWLATHRDRNGGWSCFGSGRNLDSWEGLSAFARYPRQKWTEEMRRAVDLGVEFYLQRELHKQGDHYEPWYRFHHPVHYYYDLLVGLELVTALGRGADPRLEHALSVLKRKRRADGRWNLDAVHPDLEGKMADWYAAHPKHRPTPFALEAPGEPSKIITLRAYLVLERLDETASPSR